MRFNLFEFIFILLKNFWNAEQRMLLSKFLCCIMIQDDYKTQGMRTQLMRQLRLKGICDDAVLDAMKKVPRHLFMDKDFLKQAYSDIAFQIGKGQTISQPYTVAYQTSLLDVKSGDKVLEIGTGSGYQTSVLLELGAKVYSIERQKELYDKTKVFLPSINYNPKLFYGDGYKGLPAFAPFDKILVTCGAPFIPQDLMAQLKVGGILVIPVGAGKMQVMTTVLKLSDFDFETHELDQFSFVPMLGEKERG